MSPNTNITPDATVSHVTFPMCVTRDGRTYYITSARGREDRHGFVVAAFTWMGGTTRVRTLWCDRNGIAHAEFV